MGTSVRAAPAADPEAGADTGTGGGTGTRAENGIGRGADLNESAFPLSVTVPAFNASIRPALIPIPTERVPVRFCGDGEGVGELTWGQREILQAMVRQGWISLGGVLALPPGATVQGVADQLDYMVSRFPSMRTKLRFDARGYARQEVHSSGEVMLDVFDLEPGADPDETAARIEACYRTRPRDFCAQWPVQMGVLRQDGRPTHVIAISCHTVSDGLGMQALGREVDARLTEPAIGLQQLELAAWQDSPAGRRISDAAIRHMEKALRSVPPRPLPLSDDERDPRHWTGVLRSRALKLALPNIAARTEADSSAVLMALYATALGRLGLLNPAVIRPLSSNRFRPGLTDMVGNLVQSGVCILDTAETTIDDVVRRARQVSMTVRKYSYFDPRAETALVERLAREARELDPDAQSWSCANWAFFNDRRVAPGEAARSPQELETARAHTGFGWFEKKENPYEQLFLHIDDVEDGIAIMVCADTRHISPACNEALAREMEAAAIEAAFNADAPTRVSKPTPTPSTAIAIAGG
ncbi:MAG TPA: condensation domain-containing protein [Actinocrinis sp.]|nr:condensation domain-containing protein [Actinocrinis sp.]